MRIRGEGCASGGTGIEAMFYPDGRRGEPNLGGAVACHPLAGRPLGADARAFVDWLAAAGQRWWQVLPLTPPDEHRLPSTRSASAFAAWPELLEDPDASFRRGGDAFGARHWVLAGGLGAVRGPGAVADQVRFDREWTLCAPTRRSRACGSWRPAHLRGARLGRPRRPPGDLPGGPRGGGAADDYAAEGQHWADPLYDWPALQRRRYGWWASSASAHLRPLRRRPHRPLPRVRRLLGHSGRVRTGQRGTLKSVDRAGRRSTRRGRPAIRCPSSPRTSATSRRPSSGCATRSASPGWWSPCSALTATTRTTRTGGEPRRAPGGLRGHGTRTTPRGGGGRARRRSVRLLASDSRWQVWRWRRALVVAGRAHARLAGPDGDGPRRRTVLVSQSLGGPHERAGREAGNWRWRLEPGQLTDAHARQLRAATEAAGRA